MPAAVRFQLRLIKPRTNTSILIETRDGFAGGAEPQ
jgi:hypothetical protein